MPAHLKTAYGLLQSLTTLALSVIFWAACGDTVKEVPLRELKERQFSVQILSADDGGFVVDLSLGYQQFPGNCLSIPSESIATFNGARLPIEIRTGTDESCYWPRISRKFHSLPEGEVSVLTLTDGDLNIRMVAKDFLTPRRITVQGGALILGSSHNTLLLEPPTDSVYVTQSAYFPMINDATTGTPALVNVASDFRNSDDHPQFFVPLTAPTGPGILQIRSTLVTGPSLVCENAETCRATREMEASITTSITHARIDGLFKGSIGHSQNEICQEDSCIDYYFYGQGTTMDVLPAPGQHSFAAPATRVTARWVMGEQLPKYPHLTSYEVYIPFDFKLMQVTNTELLYRAYSSHADEFGCDYRLSFANPERTIGFYAQALGRCEASHIPDDLAR